MVSPVSCLTQLSQLSQLSQRSQPAHQFRVSTSRWLRFVLLTIPVLLVACATPTNDSPLLSAEPELGAELQRAPRTLRLYFEALPDVSQSNVRLLGADGEYELRGLHTMAADDLMVEIMEPLAPGKYTVEWSTVVGADPTLYAGSYQFTVIP